VTLANRERAPQYGADARPTQTAAASPPTAGTFGDCPVDSRSRTRPTLLVDAYNALHVTGVLPPELAGPDLRTLAGLIAQSRYASRHAWLVCDGAPADSRRSGGLIHQPVQGVEGVEIVYAGPGRDADSAIERLVERDTAPRRLLVVSSDRRILVAARKRRCGALPSDVFLRHLAQDHACGPRSSTVYPEFALDVPLDPVETKRWRDRLGVSDLHVPASPDPLAGHDERRPGPPRRDEPERPLAADEPAAPAEPPDPIIAEALREWEGRLDPGELDMRRWLGDGGA